MSTTTGIIVTKHTGHFSVNGVGRVGTYEGCPALAGKPVCLCGATAPPPKITAEKIDDSEICEDKGSWFRRGVIWLLHITVSLLLLSTWLIAGPGMLVAWIIETIAERLEVWEVELEHRSRKAR